MWSSKCVLDDKPIKQYNVLKAGLDIGVFELGR